MVVEVPADQKDDCDEDGVPHLLHKPVIIDETQGT